MKGSRDDFFAGAMFSGDQNVGVRRSDLSNQLQDRRHRRGFRQKCRARFGAQDAVFGFETRGLPQRLAQFDLRAQNGEQASIFPGLLDKVTRAAAHRLYRQFDAAPCGHDNNRQRAVEHLYASEKIEPLLARCRVSRVVEVHQDGVKFPGFDGAQSLGRRGDALRFVALAL